VYGYWLASAGTLATKNGRCELNSARKRVVFSGIGERRHRLSAGIFFVFLFAHFIRNIIGPGCKTTYIYIYLGKTNIGGARRYPGGGLPGGDCRGEDSHAQSSSRKYLMWRGRPVSAQDRA
jgi:hypothetical protein